MGREEEEVEGEEVQEEEEEKKEESIALRRHPLGQAEQSHGCG